MKIFISALIIVILSSVSLCLADDGSLQKARALYYKGEKAAAISMMEDYAELNPDPEIFYFLGYAYYEMEDMGKSAEYFNRAFIREPFYSPMSAEEADTR